MSTLISSGGAGAGAAADATSAATAISSKCIWMYTQYFPFYGPFKGQDVMKVLTRFLETCKKAKCPEKGAKLLELVGQLTVYGPACVFIDPIIAGEKLLAASSTTDDVKKFTDSIDEALKTVATWIHESAPQRVPVGEMMYYGPDGRITCSTIYEENPQDEMMPEEADASMREMYSDWAAEHHEVPSQGKAFTA